MATARCYTKSGNVEKYELNCFSGVFNHYPINFYHNIIGPDSNGNYTITYEGYDDANSNKYDCYCKTIYGPDWKNNKGEIKTFYFIKGKTRITFRLSNLNSYGVGTITCSISGPLPTDVFVTIARIDGSNGFSVICHKTNSDKGSFHFQYTNQYPSKMPKVGEQWNIEFVRGEPIGTDLGDFEYAADATPFTIKE